jgi:hypothetical protein
MFKFGVVLGFILVVLAIGPILTIWAWNVLFGAGHPIPYTLETWAATVILGGLFTARVSSK